MNKYMSTILRGIFPTRFEKIINECFEQENFIVEVFKFPDESSTAQSKNAYLSTNL